MSKQSVRKLAGLSALVLTGSLSAAPVSLDFIFDGALASVPNSARAVGTITFEDTLLPNPGGLGFAMLPHPAVLDISVTVTGASTGNGTFTLADFDGVEWDTNGGTLDLNQQLVGQPTNGSPWGTTPSSGEAGDFNLFAVTNTCGGVLAPNPHGPEGTWYFTMTTDGCEEMVLTSMQPAAAVQTGDRSVPVLSPLALLTLAGLLGWFGFRRKCSAD